MILKNKWILSVSSVAVSSVFFFGLTACSRHHIPAYVENPTTQNLTEQQRKLLADIESSGVQVIKQGMVFTFVIPTDCFFVKETRELKSHRGRDLDQLANFIHSYTQFFVSPHIKITAYTDKTWLYPARQILSMHYAEIISDFLRSDGIDSNIITVRGRGAEHPIASNRYPMGTAFNRRIEINIK